MAVGIAVRDLAHAVRIGVLRGLESPRDKRVEVGDEERVRGVAGMLRLLHSVAGMLRLLHSVAGMLWLLHNGHRPMRR